MTVETTTPVTPPNPVSPETIRRYVGTEGIVGPDHAARIALEALNNKEVPLAQFFAKIAKDFSFAKALSAVDGDSASISWKDLSKLAAGKAFIAKADVGTVPELNEATLSDLLALSKLIPSLQEQTVSEPYKLLSSNSTPYVQPQASQQPEPVYYAQSAQNISSPPPQIIYLQPIQSPCYPPSPQGGYPQQLPYYPQPQPSACPPMPYPAYPQPYGQDPYATAHSGGYGACPPTPYSMPYSAPCPPPPPPVQPTPQPPIYQTNNYYNNTYNTYNTTHNTFNNQVYNNQTYTTNNNQRYNMPMNFNQLNNSGQMAFNTQTMNQYNRNTFPPMPYRGAMPGMMMPNRPPMYGSGRMFPI
jgi:hypothetical protein